MTCIWHGIVIVSPRKEDKTKKPRSYNTNTGSSWRRSVPILWKRCCSSWNTIHGVMEEPVNLDADGEEQVIIFLIIKHQLLSLLQPYPPSCCCFVLGNSFFCVWSERGRIMLSSFLLPSGSLTYLFR